MTSIPSHSFLAKLFLHAEARGTEGYIPLNVMKTDGGVLKCGDITACTLPLSKSGLSAFSLTFRRPCLRGTRRPKCHSEIYSCERRLAEQRRGVCSQVGRGGREQMNLSIHWVSILSLSCFKFHLLVLPFPSTVISSLLWNSPIHSSFFQSTQHSLTMFQLLSEGYIHMDG